MDFLGRLHLLLLHFPIGLLGLAVLLEVLARWQKRPEFLPAARLALAVGAATAIAAAACGWLLAGQGLYPPVALFWHRWLGVGTAALAAATWLGRDTAWRLPALLATSAVLTAAGHFGGTLTHGEGYLTEPFSENETAATAVPLTLPKPESIVFQEVVQPMLQKKCVSCHGPAKQKGGLRLDSPEAIRAGGDSRKPMLVPGQPDESELLRRAALPMADEKHMPPSGKPQLTPDELVLLRWWLAEGGADFGRRMADVPVPPDVQAVFDRAKNAAAASPVFAKKITSASPSDIEKLRQNGVAAMPLGAGSPWLSVSYAGQRDLTAAKINSLKNVREQTTHLDFGHTNLDGAGLKIAAELPHLTRLNLAETRISDADLRPLAGLEFLENLNLTGTRVTDAGLDALSGLKNLRQLHLWRTGCTETGVQKLRAQLPDLQINTGAPPDTNAAPLQLRAPKIVFGRTVFADTVQVRLEFPFSGIDLFYALDEASPTTASPRYEGKPLVFEKTTRLRTFAAREGWANSPIAEATFVRKRHSAKSVTLVAPPHPLYPANGAASLSDGFVFNDRSEKGWLGFEGVDMTAVLDFGEAVDIQRVNVHFFEDNSPWIFAPVGLRAWVSDDAKRWQPCFAKAYPKPTAMQSAHTGFRSETPDAGAARARYLKITVENLGKNPPFHPTPGGKSWIFVDEIFVE